VSSSDSLAWLPAAERRLLHVFAGAAPLAGVHASVAAFFDLTSDSTSEQIQLVRLMVHLCALSLGADKHSTLALFRTMATDALALREGSLPCMPEDPLAMAVKALGGRWYTCVNGMFPIFFLFITSRKYIIILMIQ
jgi:hypothetical protein